MGHTINKLFACLLIFSAISWETLAPPICMGKNTFKNGLETPSHDREEGVECAQHSIFSFNCVLLKNTPDVKVGVLELLASSNRHEAEPAEKKDTFAPYLANT